MAAVLGNHAHTIAVTVEGKTYFRIGGFKRLNQVSQVLRNGRVGMMVGKSPIHLAKQLDYLAPQSAI